MQVEFRQRQSEFLCLGLGPSEFSARGLGLLALVYFGALVFAAVLAPLVFMGAQAWASASPETIPGFLAKRLEPSDFPRYFDRLRWLPVVLALPWLIRASQLASWRRLGFSGPVLKPLGWGLLAGLTMLLPVTLALLFRGEAHAAHGLGALPGALVAGLGAGLLLALLEETVFRGLIFRLFYAALRPLPAVLLGAAFFAMVHFKKVHWPDGAEVTLLSGFWVAGQSLLAFVTAWEPIKALNLFLAGVLLTLVLLRTRSLWPCIGLHAGWVAYRAAHRETFEVSGGDPFWGGAALIDGLWASCWLIAAIGIFALASGPRAGLFRRMRYRWKRLAAQLRDLDWRAWQWFRATWQLWAVGVLLGGSALWLFHFADRSLLAAIQLPRDSAAHELARWLSRWGDFFRLNFILLLGGWLVARKLKSAKWRRYTLAVFLAAVMAGASVNVLRPVLGRPRPSAELPDGFHGPHLQHDYHGFPSGHASTAFATGTAIAIIYPPAAVPALGGAGAVAWSRLQLNRHHPTDSVAGAALGAFWGTLFALAARRKRPPSEPLWLD